MADRSVSQKMGVVPGIRAHLDGAPPASVIAMALPDLDLVESLDGEFDHLHLFVTTRAAMRDRLPALRDHLAPGGRLWVSWPKGGRLGTDLTIRSVIGIGYELGLVESTCLRVDDTWSALKFTRPKPGKHYANTYGTLPTDEPPVGERCRSAHRREHPLQ